MSLTDLASVGSFVSGVAVLISLLYIAYQVRQNTKHTRALIQSARVDRLMSQMIGFSDNDQCAAYLAGNGHDPTPTAIRERQFYMQCLGQVATMLDVFTQHGAGLLSDEQFGGVCATYRVWLREPGFRRMVTDHLEHTGHSSPKFSAFVAELMKEAETRARPT
jgi:hypothetical protein